MKFTCSCCGIEQKEYPALGYSVPVYYSSLSDEEKEKAELTTDTCVVEDGEYTYRFIRVVLTQKVNDSCQDLDYGVWVSLSEASFKDYTENADVEEYEGFYFGWLNAYFPPYELEELDGIKTDVVYKGGGKRPTITLQSDQENHSRFVEDYNNGISKEEAERRINEVLNLIADRE